MADTYGWKSNKGRGIALAINNERDSQQLWMEAARECRASVRFSGQVQNGIWTPEEAAQFYLADRLKKAITENAPDDMPLIYSQLLQSALCDVDWEELAAFFISALPPEEDDD